MGLLADFKTALGLTGTSNDSFYISYYLTPAIDRAAALATNIKTVTVTLTPGTQTYTLTSSAVASPVVGSAGIQDLVFDGEYSTNLQYKRDYYIKDKTTLYFVNSGDTYSGTFSFKYNGLFTKPVSTETDTTDMPSILNPAVLKYATALYALAQIVKASGTGSGVESKSEDGLSVSYGSTTGRKQVYNDEIAEAEDMMRQCGASSSLRFFSSQII